MLVALAFIPGFGLIFAALAVVRSRKRADRKWVIALSLLGSLVTLVPLASFVGVRITGMDERMLEAQAQANLSELGLVLERFEQRNGRYPENLDEVLGVAQLSSLAFDPISPRRTVDGRGPRHQYVFYRSLAGGKGYQLFSRGWDGVPYTEDDVYPRNLDRLRGLEKPERAISSD